MLFPTLTRRLFPLPSRALLILLAFAVPCYSQSSASLQGKAVDQNGAIVPGATITVRNRGTSDQRKTTTDAEGFYQVPALPVGSYRVEAQAHGFRTQVIEELGVEVGRTMVRDFRFEVGDMTEQVLVPAAPSLIEQTTVSVGQVIDQKTVQEIPLNGRYFLDLALLIPGSVTPSANGFSATPSRGVGALAINTAGNREETVNYLINGITLNNQAFSSISFQPSISTVSEFKVDNSTFSAETGQTSGAIVNIATRSGTNGFHGEAFDFLRNDALDARNFFNFTSNRPPPFKRNQFGGNLGGPIIKNRMFFFAAYEGLRQRQEVALNSLVLSNAQRAAVTDPLIARLVALIPAANFVDSSGTPRFVGSATAPVATDQWAIDVSYNLREKDRLHGYYHIQRVNIVEPNRSGNTVPGFGHTFVVQRQIFTLTETHIFGPDLVNEIRLGFNRTYGTATPNAQLDPTTFGIRIGVNQPIGLPQINIAGGLNFGGPANQPVGRGDTTFVVADSVNYLRGKHSIKLGGEFRQFLSNNFALDTGRFNFGSVGDFIAGTANSFSITLGDRTSSIAQGALNLFIQDNFKWRSNLAFELGLRYEWNMSPTERFNRFIVFDPQSVSLLRVGPDVDIYHQNNKNFEPRVGFVWDPFKNGKTSVRAAFAVLMDEPMTSIVASTTANPPLTTPLTFSGPIKFDNAITLAGVAGLAPTTIDSGYDNSYLQSWNVNVQRELAPRLALMVGYFGSKGTHLVIRRNINQPANGVRPFPALSPSSPILPGAPLGNITEVEGTGNSSYNALWATITRRLTRGLQFNASYTWSKSLDYNSLNSQGIVVQNSYDVQGDRGLSDYDARHRLVVNATYDLPFSGGRLVEGWQLAAIVQVQSGNPINIVTSNSTVNGVPNTLRPDVTGPSEVTGSVDRWFDTSVFVPVATFGNLGRNVITGPGFSNTDFSIMKNTPVGEKVIAQFRVEFFDVFNHANFGQPGNVVGSANFGRITSTRFSTGESGSSRQVQLAVRLSF